MRGKSRFIFTLAIPLCLLFTIIIASYGVQKVQARIEEFNDTNNNLTVSIQPPDNWNSGTAFATLHAINWRGYGLAAVNDNASAFFAIINLPAVANLVVPLSQITGLINILLSQYVTIDNQYNVNFTDGSTGHAYSISVTPDELNKIQSIVPSINKPLDAAIIITQHHEVTYAIVYATQLGRMGEFLGTFQNILGSVKFGSATYMGRRSLDHSTLQIWVESRKKQGMELVDLGHYYLWNICVNKLSVPESKASQFTMLSQPV